MSVIDLNGQARGTLERKIAGALKQTIAAHGPITLSFVSSAVHRITSVIKEHNRATRELQKHV